MVKSYTRYELEKAFGVISASSNIVWMPSTGSSGGSSGRAVVGALEDVLVWDLKTSTLLSRWNTRTAATVSAEAVVQVAYEPNLGLVAAGYSDGAIRIWDSSTGEMTVQFNGHKSAVSCLSFDKSGTRLVSGSKDSSIIMWDLVAEEGMYKLRSHRDQVTDVKFVRRPREDLSDETYENEDDDEEEENYLISVSKDGLMKMWDLETQSCLETHVSHRGECWSISLDGSRVITTGNDKEVKVWNLDWTQKTGEQLQSAGMLEKSSGKRGLQVKVHPDGGYFAIANADNSIEVWREKSEEQIKKSIARKLKRAREKNGEEAEVEINEIVERYSQYAVIRANKEKTKVVGFDWVANEKSKKQLDLVATFNDNSIQTFSVPAGKKTNAADFAQQLSVDLPGHRTDIRALTISSDDRLVASAANGQLKVWNIKTSSCLRTFACGYALCVSFLPGDSLIVCGTKSGKLQLFDVASSTLLQEVDAHESEVWSLHLSADGKSMVTGGTDGSAKFWEFRVVQDEVPGTNRTVSRLKLKHKRTLELGEAVISVRFSPDGKYVACSLMNYAVQVFFADTLKFYLKLYGHKLPVVSMDFSHDSKLIVTASSDKNIKIWGMDFGDCHKSIFAHDDAIMGVQFEPDSHNFISIAKDREVKYWDADKFVQIQKLTPGHHDTVFALAVARSSAMLITAGADKSIRVWQQFDEPLFIEEEREKELEELHENALTASIEETISSLRVQNGDLEGDDDDNSTIKERAGKQTIETLKAGERLMEALEIGVADLELIAEHNKTLKTNPRAAMPPRNVVLGYKKITAEKHVLEVLSKIKPAQLEDALVVLPFDKATQLLRFIELWVADSKVFAAGSAPLISRVLVMVLRTHHKQLVTHKTMREMLESVRTNLRDGLESYRAQISYNMAGLSYIKTAWSAAHEREFKDDYEYKQEQERHAKKRAFTTV